MTQEEFVAALRGQGFAEPVLVEREANGYLAEHTHPFEARALIIDGEITLQVDGRETLYRPGEVFHLRANQAHGERYGPSGVRYLSGRK